MTANSAAENAVESAGNLHREFEGDMGDMGDTPASSRADPQPPCTDISRDTPIASPPESHGKPDTCAAKAPDMPSDKPAPPIKPLSPLDSDIVAYLSRVATTASEEEVHRQVHKGQQGRTLALVRVALHKLVQGGLVDKINGQYRLAGRVAA